MDEIGETSPEAQAMLLRVLETGEIQQVGAEKPQRVDVRVIAATDVNLERCGETGQFKTPLFYRLAGFEIALPPLRKRREDIGRLLLHFIQQEMLECGGNKLVDPGPYGSPWLPAPVVAGLIRYDWPGNVRQLRNVARQLVVGSQGHPLAQIDERIERLADCAENKAQTGPAQVPKAAAKTAPARETSVYREPWDVEEEEMLSTLRECRWNVKQAADILGISRPSLYALIDACPKVRKASELSRDEIVECLEKCASNLDAMVDELMVSKRGLKMRMKELGIR